MLIESTIVLALIAAIFTTDMTGFGQFMLHRPIFCAPVFGYLTGDVVAGIWLGLIIEMIWINAVPLGASLPPDISAISILTVFWANKYFPGLSSAGIFALSMAIPFGYLCKYIDKLGRKINTGLMNRLEKQIEQGKFNKVNKAIFTGLLLFILKFFVFYIVAMIFGGIAFSEFYLTLPVFVLNGLSRAWFILPLLGFGTVVYNFAAVRILGARK
jgi:mannose/fructose/N-acetylgalactosamine-specific phosphotransferase system component IIC